MPSNYNTQTDALTGVSTAAENPGGMTMDNTVIGSLVPAAGTFTTLTYTSLIQGSGGIATTTSSSGSLSNTGLSVLAPSSAASYILPAPTTIGAIKRISTISASTNQRVTSSGSFIGSTAATTFLFNGVGQSMSLMASSLTQWVVIGQSTAALST